MDKDLVADIYFEWEPYIHGVIFEFMQKNKIDYQLTEDLRQDVVIHMLKVIPEYNAELSQMSTFLYNRVYQFLLNKFTKEFRRSRLGKQYAEEARHTYDPEYHDTENTYEFDCLLETADLTNKQEEYLRLRYIGGCTNEEIAKSKGCKRQSVQCVIDGALTKLRETNPVK